MTISFFVPGLPKPGVNSWKGRILHAALKAMAGQPPIPGALGLSLVFTRARPASHYDTAGDVKAEFTGAVPVSTPDALTLARAVAELLCGAVYAEPGQVFSINAEARFGDPGVEVSAWEW